VGGERRLGWPFDEIGHCSDDELDAAEEALCIWQPRLGTAGRVSGPHRHPHPQLRGGEGLLPRMSSVV